MLPAQPLTLVHKLSGWVSKEPMPANQSIFSGASDQFRLKSVKRAASPSRKDARKARGKHRDRWRTIRTETSKSQARHVSATAHQANASVDSTRTGQPHPKVPDKLAGYGVYRTTKQPVQGNPLSVENLGTNESQPTGSTSIRKLVSVLGAGYPHLSSREYFLLEYCSSSPRGSLQQNPILRHQQTFMGSVARSSRVRRSSLGILCPPVGSAWESVTMCRFEQYSLRPHMS